MEPVQKFSEQEPSVKENPGILNIGEEPEIQERKKINSGEYSGDVKLGKNEKVTSDLAK